MAGDVNSNIFINVDTSSAMAQLRALEKELTALNRALVVGTKTAAQAQSKYAQGLLHNVNATGQWTASMTRMSTASEQFANSLDRSKLSLKEYFRYGMASTKTFGRVFGSEFDTVSKLVQKRVKTLQQQYVQLGRDAQGAMNALKFTPKALNYRDVTTQLMMATQRQQIFNKLLDDGSTKLLNFGKNTQWAGRQLMVGFTVPLMLFGAQAIRVFKEIETQTIRFKKVYGDIFTDPGQTDLALKNIRALADEYTKYGVKVADTIKMAADAAAAGNSGKQLEQIVEQTNRLAVLGGVTQEKALETTIALKNAFQIGAEDLDQTINFLNAVENQTVVALEDLTEAIPRVAPVVQQLGGDVKDLAFFMAAMQEGGISAAQGANALKSGLGSLINPSNKAAEAAAKVGVNIRGIVEANQGNLRNIVVGFAQALEPLTDLQKTRVIEDVFGKYQFARISALLNNVTKDGTQAARVLQLANSSVEELGILAERELGVQANSSMNKFVGAVERLKAAIAPVGEVFAKTLTPVIEFITKMAERFNKLPDGVKKAIAVIGGIVGGLGPIFLMTFGLMANAMANAMKGFNLLRKGYQQLAYGSSDAALKTQYLTQEELENISVTNALYSTHDRLSAAYKIESTALGALIAQYGTATNAMRNFSMANPGLFVPGKGVPPIRRAGGGEVSGPGTSTSDSIPAYLSDGEYVVNAKAVDTYGVETFEALNARKFAGGGPVFKNGIPRMFTGGLLSRMMQSVMPKTRLGVVPSDGFSLSGFTGLGSRVSASRLVPSKPTFKKIPWQEDPSDPKSLIISDPTTGQKFKIAKTSKGGFDRLYDDLVQQGRIQKRGARPEMSPEEYLIHRLFKKYKQGKPLTPLNVLGQAGSAGKSRVRVTGVSEARGRWGRSVDKPKVRALQQFFDREKDHLRSVLPKEVFDTLQANNSFVVSPSHIISAGRNRKVSDWAREKILRDTSLVNFGMNYLTRSGARLPKNTPHPTTQAEAENVIKAIELLKTQGPLAPTLQGTLEALKYRNQQGFYNNYAIKDTDLGLKMGGQVKKYENGVFSVPGPKGAGDVVPAMLSPGEAVIPTAESEKYRPLIRSIIADKVPGFGTGRTGIDDPWDTPSNAPKSRGDILADKISGKVADATTRSGILGGIARRITSAVDRAANSGPTPMTSMERNAAARGVPPTLAQPFMALNNTVAANTAAVQDGTDTTQTSSKTAKQIANEQKKLKKTQGVGGYFRGFGKVPDVDPETGRPLSYQEKTNYRQNNRMQRTQAMMGPSMALSMAGSMGMMYGMSKPDSFAGQNMGLLMGITALGSLLPLLNSPMKMLIASVVGLVAIYKMQSNAIKQSILDGQEQAKAMSMTTSKLEALGKYTQQVSITQVSAAQRAARTTEITPVNQTFGFNFLDSETGKQFKKDFDKTVDQFGTQVASRNLASQLSSAVQQGVFTAEEAESVATYLARSLKDTVLEAQLRGRIIELVGPNGENLSKDPYALNVSIMADARSLEQVMLQKLESTMKDIDAGLLGVSGSRQASGKPGGSIVGDPRKWNEGLQLAITTLIAGGISFGKIFPKLRDMLAVSMAGIGSIASKARLGKTVFSNVMAGGAIATSRLPGGTLRGGGAAVKGAETASKASKVGRAITGVRAAGAAVKGASLVAAGAGSAAGGVGAIPGLVSFAISSAIFGGIELGLRQWQRGEEKKAIAKVAGQIAGVTTENLALSQQGIDAMNAEYNAAIENLNIRKKQATNAAERAKLEESILDLEQKRDTAVSESRKQQAQILKDAANYLDQIESQGAKDKYVEAYSEQFKKKFKDDPFMKARGESLMTTMKEQGVDQKATIQVQALVTSDQLSLGQAEALVTTLTADGGNLEKQLDLVIKTTGIEGLTRYAEITQYLNDNSKKQLKQVVNQGLLSGQKDAIEGLYSSLEELIKLPDFVGIDLDIEIDPDDIRQLKIIGKDVNALKKQFDGKPITLEALTKYQQELNGQGVTNNVLDTAIKNWQLLQSLDPSVRLQAMMSLQTLNISDSITADTASEQKAAFLKTERGKSLKKYSNVPGGQDLFDKEFAAYQNSAAGRKVAQDYITDLMNRIFPKAKVDTTKKGGPVTEEGNKGAMDVSWLSELLQKLKLFRESTIDSTGTFKELLGQVEKYFGAKLFKANPMLTALDKQRSAIEQIKKSSADAGITLSSSFINLLESLDAEAFEDIAKKLFTINSEGKYALKLLPGVAEQMAKMEPEGRVVKPNQTVVGVINEAFKAGNLVDFINKQRDAIAQTKSLTGAFIKLTDGTLGFKMTADQAAKVISDLPGMAEDIAKGVMKLSQDDIDGINKSLKEYYSTLAKSNTEKLLPATSVIENQTKALDALVAENIDLDVALKIIQDQAMAAYIALDPSVIKGDLAEVIQQFVTLEEVVKKLEDSTFFKQRTATLQLKKDFAAIAPLLLEMGLDLEDINAILSNPNLAKAFIQDLKDGKLDAEQLKTYIDEIPEYKRVELELKLSTREGKEEEFDKLFNKAMEYYDLLEGKIEDDFEPLLESAQDKIDATQEKIEGINEEIKDFQDNIDTKQRKIELEITRPIDVLQKESNALGNDLDLMNRSADEITKRYDEQAEALTKVSEINSRIANQQKQQLSLADALSQGDISAAALAAQEIRATSAEAMQEDQLGILGAAKERDIANLRSKGGLTRLQIENRQFAISQEIYALEQKREVELLAIRDIEDKIYDIKEGRLKLAQDELDLANKALKDYQNQRDAAIEAVDRQREVWRDAKLAIGFARIDAGYYNDVISFSNTLIDLMKDGWLGVGDAILAAVAALALYNAALKKPVSFEEAQAKAQATLTGYLDNFGTQLGNADQQIVDLELKIAEAMEKGQDTTALEAQLAALRASTEVLADNMYDVAKTLDKVDNATNIAGINRAVSQGTSVLKNPYGDIDVEWDGPIWVPGDRDGGAGADFVQVASKGGIIKPKYLRKGGMTSPLYRPMGGLIPYFLGGGFAKGTDTVPAMLTPGEFVMSRYAVNAHGVDRMKAINSGDSIGESVYNYSINVNVKSDANPDEIARAVMTHIKQVDSKRLRGAQI